MRDEIGLHNAYGNDLAAEHNFTGSREMLPDLEAAEGGGCKILQFPDNRVAKLRRLVHAVRSSFTAHDGVSLPGLELFSFTLGPGGYDLLIDEHASIDLFPGSPDYRFTISMREGRQTLLVTADPLMMADFLRQYILARIECHPELQERL